jgi:uncharacterized protein (DUF2147 family)
MSNVTMTFTVIYGRISRAFTVAAILACLGGVAMAQTPPPAVRPPPSAPTAAPPAMTPFAGVWLDDTGQGAIEIAPCGERLCGRIVWLKNPNDKTGKPLTDGYNPEKIKRNQPICGLSVIGDLKLKASGSWDEGWIYDPKEGKSYDLELKLRGTDRLVVTGYLGMKFLGETFVWTRAPAELPRCVTTSAVITR